MSLRLADICPPGTKRVQLHGPSGPADAWVTVRGLSVGERHAYLAAIEARRESGDDAAFGATLPLVLGAVVAVDGVLDEAGAPVTVEALRSALLGDIASNLGNVLNAINGLTFPGARAGN